MPNLREATVTSLFIAPLLFVVFVSLLAPVPGEVSPEMSTEKLRAAEIVPDVIDAVPGEPVHVKYSDALEVKMGNELKPSEVAKKPVDITWTGHPNRHYTLAMVDPDAPSRTAPKNRNWLHWLVVNIPGQDISQGDVAVEYAGSAPPQGTNKHRYVFLVFEQQGVMERPSKIDKRGGFDMKKYARTHHLGTPIAGNYFLAEHE